ncbi:FecR family protein [Sphingopyxis yananensis]|uniref:FecR family protein n=1 Tax=Sphingopyxis yananensis TaxID=2886687 RepID=UPI001D0FC553|nr:FecR domain-containing protein [Sphingopyxis yananensis]MCC2602246.1 FecR domain-containing protein [Sphingopyxis yananensis]
MMRETAQAIEAEAARWAAQCQINPENTDNAELAAWLAGDSRRRGAFLQAQAAAIAISQTAEADPKLARQAQPWRRAAIASAAALCLLISGTVAMSLWPNSQNVATNTGEIRRLPLADGSMAIINTQSEVQLKITDERREIALRKGEAWFKVAHDRNRPFTVISGDVRVRAIGTAFSVRRINTDTQVLVNEGVVEIWVEGSAAAPQRLYAGEFLAINQNRPASPKAVKTNAALDLLWREGKIDLAGRSLSFAIAEFNRYNDRKILLADASIANERLHGIFNVNDPVQFAMALRDGLDIDIELAGNSDIILGCCSGGAAPKGIADE